LQRGRKEIVATADFHANSDAMHMIRKGQIEGVGKGNIQAQNQFIAGLFGLGP
jgi:hypothetical protein